MAARPSLRQGTKRGAATAWRVPMVTSRQVRARYQGYGRAPFARRGRKAAEGEELKFHDVDYDDGVVAAGAVVNTAGSLTLITQGVTESTRVGRKCTLKSIGCRYDFTLPQIVDNSPGFGDVMRLIVYQDKQTNKAIAVNTDILETADYQSFNNLSNKGRFVILCDRTVNLNYTAGGADATANSYAGGAESGTFFKDVNIPLEFNASAGAVADLNTNNVNVMICSKNGVGGFASKWRFRFTG